MKLEASIIELKENAKVKKTPMWHLPVAIFTLIHLTCLVIFLGVVAFGELIKEHNLRKQMKDNSNLSTGKSDENNKSAEASGNSASATPVSGKITTEKTTTTTTSTTSTTTTKSPSNLGITGEV